MDKYHIYEEIGKGDFSQVFKGREKKKIEYVAIKRVDKGMMAKIVNEVQIMHKLQSPHILKFHDWYETRNNLWLIIEYCTGADVESLLKQDGYLPELSVRMLGLDMISGLKYMHSLGILHCDLRPKNFLIDEYGILKISDFKLARKLPKVPLGDALLDTRGTPTYMSPELFTYDGVHSYSSEFWALGCVLYELRKGVAPFGNHTMIDNNELISNIQSIEPIHYPKFYMDSNCNNGSTINMDSKVHNNKLNKIDNNNQNNNKKKSKHSPVLSAELGDLLQWLLEKSPNNRCEWPELLAHPFWNTESNISRDNNQYENNFPVQNSYDVLIKNMEKSRIEKLEKDTYDEIILNSAPTSVLLHNVLPLPMSDSTPIRPQTKSTLDHIKAEKLNDLNEVSNRKRTDIKAITANIRNNIDNNNNNNNRNINNHSSDINRISEDNYSENFEELDENSFKEETKHEISLINNNYNNMKDNKINNLEKSSIMSLNTDKHSVISTTSSKETVAIITRKDNITDNSTLITSPSSYQLEKQNIITKNNTIIRNNQNNINIESINTLTNLQDVPSELLVNALIMHSSDSQVKPIVGNKLIETIEAFVLPKAVVLPFPLYTPEDIASLTDLEAHLGIIYKYLLKNSNAHLSSGSSMLQQREQLNNSYNDRVNVLTYLCSIGTSAEVANIILNTHFLSLLLKLLRQTTTSNSSVTSKIPPNTSSSAIAALTNSRVLAATTLALMLRYATYIQPPNTVKSKDDHILPSLITLLKETSKLDSKLKRRIVSAFGETVFYITAQDDDNTDINNKWTLPSGVISILIKSLKDESDEIIRHYAAKTIENILAQGGVEFKRRFLVVEIASKLLEMSQHSRNESLQATCGMAVSHILMLVMTSEPTVIPITTPLSTRSNSSPSSASKSNLNSTTNSVNHLSGVKFLTRVLDKGWLPGIIEILKEGQPKLQQAYCNIINIIFCPNIRNNDKESNNSASTVLKPLQQYFLKSSGLISILLRLVEQGGSLAVRAKALLTLQLLCHHKSSILTEHRLPTALMRQIEPYTKVKSNIHINGIDKLHSTSSYNIKTVLSMIYYIRETSINSLKDINTQLVLLTNYKGNVSKITNSSTSSIASPDTFGYISPTKSSGYGNKFTTKISTPSSIVRQTPNSALKRNNIEINSTSSSDKKSSTSLSDPNIAPPNMELLSNYAGVLRASISIASHPILGRFILGNGSILINYLSTVIRSLSLARNNIIELINNDSNNKQQVLTSLEKESYLDSFGLTEQAILYVIETIAQFDLSDSVTGIQANGNWPEAVLKFIPSEEESYSFIMSIQTDFISALASLSLHSDGDVRVLVAASLRRLLPITLKAIKMLSNNNNNNINMKTCVSNCLSEYLSYVPKLLNDLSPIPQYTIRILADTSIISEMVVQEIIKVLCNHNNGGGLETLMRILKGYSNSYNISNNKSDYKAIGSDDEDDNHLVGYIDENTILFKDLFNLLENEIIANQ